jgi:hypothetical protein
MGLTPYTTAGATGQDGEIVPLTGWFDPDIQNSVWFTIVAPASGCINIEISHVPGALDASDMQLALYSKSVGRCDDFDTFDLVAADDDSGFRYSPLIQRAYVNPSETYYIQLDGYDGNIGSGYLEITSDNFRRAEQFYCRVLRRQGGPDAIAGWLDYLETHTIKDLMRLGILTNEFKTRFVNGESDETVVRLLYDVLLAREAEAVALAIWTKEVGSVGWENVANQFLASDEYNNRFGDDFVPGGGRAECTSPTSSDEFRRVEQFYCRVLQRPPESDQAFVGWHDYLKTHTIKDLVRFGILGDEFKIRFVTGKSDETLAGTLFDVLLARAGGPGGLDTWAEQIKIHGWDSAVNSILASDEYNTNFGDDAVPGGGRAECVSLTSSDEWSRVRQFYCRVLQRPPESDQAIVGWHGYLQSHTVKDLVRLGILGGEFKIRFIDGKLDETLASTLYDVLLARAGDAGGLENWEKVIGEFGWEYAVDQFMASDEYNDSFGDDGVPGGGRAEC